MKDQPMPEAIHALIIENSDSSTVSNDKTNCHGSAYDGHDHHVNAFTEEFEPTLNISAYPDDKITDAKTKFICFTGDVSIKENVFC
ncbi:hypothetical protein TIFTF001_052199 [Ficus carica]|uniref:Uncharacterized protein n=1 Tax=Ficus carica TaxID=3494 RepID=A0AA88JIA6_FICCA|nr:hypothetical protein TIFTF001_052199 [Ficus carica]